MLIKGANGRVVEQHNGKLRVLSARYDHLHEDSLRGNVYVASTVDQAPSLTGTAARETLITIRNQETDKDLLVKEIHLGSSAAMAFVLHKNPTGFSGIGANITGKAHSMNFGIDRSPNVAIDVWDEVAGGITGLTVVEEVQAFFNGVAEHNEDMFDSLILPPGTSLAIDKGATAGEVVAGVTFSMMKSSRLLISP